jgi:hypothetical protein
MPRYQLSVTVPPQTPESAAVSDTISVDERIVKDGFLFTPPGSAFAVRAVLFAGDRQLLPEPGSDRVLIPGVADPARIDQTLPGTPNDLELRVFAPNSQFAHTVKAVVDTRTEERARPLQRIADVFTGGGLVREVDQDEPEA